jgi:hypothetical protein
VRELNFRKPIEESRFSYTLGRFSVPEAGNSYADGVQVVKDFHRSWNLGLYGGQNPKIYGKSYLDWNSNATTYGTYLSYQAPSLGWSRNFYISHGYVTETVDSQVDRRFLFHLMNYQWSANSRLITLIYLDFVPRTYVQMGNLFWQQELGKYFYTKISALAVDTIQYVHIQNIREQLASSPYKEGSLKIDFKSSPLTTWELSGLSGVRETDNLTKTEYRLSVASQRAFGPKWDTDFHIGHRNNFTTDDDFARFGVGYYARLWELGLDLEYGVEKNRASGETLHPQIVEASIARLFSREFFGTWSVERAADERVVILSSFLKFGYRFGNKEMAPLRDGSPVKGPL